MDNAVSLVRAYLQLNGYFVVTEYPLVEQDERKKLRTLTDIDILAFRFSQAGRLISSSHSWHQDEQIHKPDPALQASVHQPDMIIAEVKEGYAKENKNMFREEVLRSILTRFGCCSNEEFSSLYKHFQQTGKAELSSGHLLRSFVFGSRIAQSKKSFTPEFISMQHVLNFLNNYIDDHWDYFRTANFRDPALSFLVALKKATKPQK